MLSGLSNKLICLDNCRTVDVVKSWVTNAFISFILVISSNLGCITPIARKVEDECNQSRFTDENYDAILVHEIRLSDNFDRMDVLSCL